MPKLASNNAEFYYELHGAGQPLIFISGFSGEHNGWFAQVEALKQQFQILIFDNRAVGQTLDDGAELSTSLMASDVIALAEALNLENPHIVGSSMGGSIAQQIAIDYPEKINKLVLMATSAKWRQAALKSVGNTISLGECSTPFDLHFDIIASWLFGDSFLNDSNALSELKNLWQNNPNVQSIADQTRQFNVLQSFDSRANLAQIQAPTLVLNGSEDLLSLPHESAYLAKHIPNAKQHTFACGHMPALEQTQALNEVLLEFLA